MKIRYLIVSFLVFSFIIYSCSADYLDNRSQVDLNSITLKANIETTTIGIDQTLEFTVIGNDDQDYTAGSTIKINGEAIEGATFSFSEGGEYTFEATYSGLTSNALTYNVATEKFLVVDKSKALRTQEITFLLLNPNGDDATGEGTFFVNGNEIDGNTFSTSEVGTYEVFASYDNGVSQTETEFFEIFIPKRKVVYEDYTGAWCGWCVRVTNAVHLLKEQSEDVVVIAIHNNDEMAFPQEAQLRNTFGVTGFPAAKINRTDTAPNPEDAPSSIDFALETAGENTSLSIAINTQLNGSILSVNTSLMSENAIPSSHKIVVYVYQDGLVFPQTNYYVNTPESPYYQMGNPILDFVHNDVLETSLTNIFGDQLQSTNAFEVLSIDFDPIDLSAYANTSNGNTFDYIDKYPELKEYVENELVFDLI
uniref:Omp28-related outer membrane protein n=1 Tax=uncultured Planktosalinus sp. TaxID=1810935 RepID=UPI0030DA3869